MRLPSSVRTAGFLVAALCLIATPGVARGQSKQGGLGSKDPGLFNLTGSIYFLKDGDGGMPTDLAKRKVEGTVYTDRLDVPSRNFTEGFPGVTDRFEWFGILYTGRFYAPVAGEYTWGLQSDDGSRLWIDNKTVIDNDGVHGFAGKSGTCTLTAGPHDIAVWYFQGPPTEIGLQLSVTLPKGHEKIFVLGEFAGPMADAVKTLKAEATPNGIRVRLDAALLFDTAKWDLKPRAQQAIKNLGQVIAGYPAANIKIVGYTDSVGADDYNIDLSKSRAQSVKEALAAENPPAGVTFETDGKGKADPVATNNTPEGRQMNRRVEVFIKPLATQNFFEATRLDRVQNQQEVRPEIEQKAEAENPAQGRVSSEAASKAAQTYAAAPTPGADAGGESAGRGASPEVRAAIARVKDVIERYAAALSSRDRALLARLRDPISDAEQALLAADQAVVTMAVSKVNVDGTNATATCLRTVEATKGGKPTKSSGAVTVQLTRKPAGWVIVDIK